MGMLTNISGWHIIAVVVVLLAIGEFTGGLLRKIALTVAAAIVAIHALRAWGGQ